MLVAAYEDRDISTENFSRPKLRSSISTVESLDYLRTMEEQVLLVLGSFAVILSISCDPSDLNLRLELSNSFGKAVHFPTSPVSDLSCLASCLSLASTSLDLLHGYVTPQSP